MEIVTPGEDAATVRTAMRGRDGPRTVPATATGAPTAIERRASTATHAARRAGRNDSIGPSAPIETPAHPARRADREVRGATTEVSTIARRGGKIATAMKHAGVTRGEMTSAGDHSRVIAIDGPAASGKSSVGRALAGRVAAIFLDTGLLYRAVTAEALERGIAPTDGPSLTQLANALDLRIAPASVGDGRAHDVLVDGEDVSGTLRTSEIDANVSAVSEHQGVRDALLPIQRRIADGGKVIMVGRDIASVVVPDAGLKIYLDAGPEIRARRRFLELEKKGVDTTYNEVLGDLLRRDEIDSTREIAPLKQARGAIILDTDHLSESEVIDRIETLVLRSWGPLEQARDD